MSNTNPSAPAASVEDSVVVAVAREPLKKIWEDTVHIDHLATHEGKDGWRCLWCNIFFVQRNSLKALVHVSKVFEPQAAIINPNESAQCHAIGTMNPNKHGLQLIQG